MDIVTLCGSTKFKEDFLKANKAYSLNGFMVFTVAFFCHADSEPLTKADKDTLDKVHFNKVIAADVVVFINKDGYIGFSTFRELVLAILYSKPLVFLYKEKTDYYMAKANRIIDEYITLCIVRERDYKDLDNLIRFLDAWSSEDN